MLDQTLNYRAKNPTPRWYSGLLHLLVTFGLGPGFLIYLGMYINWSLSLLPLGLLILTLGNLVVYIVHRWLLHVRVSWAKVGYDTHTMMHHQYFCDQHPEIERLDEMYRVLFPAYGIIFIVLGSTFTFSALAYFLGGENIALFTLFGSVLYFLLYEFVHLTCHLPRTWFITKIWPFKQLYEHHRLHHKRAYMSKYNMDIVMPFFDYIFKTVKKDD